MRFAGHGFSSFCLWFLALAFGAQTARAQNTNDILDLSPWSRSTNLRVGAGYKDNVLLGSTSPIHSSLVASELEFFLFRIPVDGTQVVFFLNGEDIRYLDSESVDKEQTLTALASVKKDFAKSWNAGLTLQYLYQDQVLDVLRIDESTTQFALSTLPAQAHSFTARPSLLREWVDHRRIELEFTVNRQEFTEPLDDYWEGGPKIILADKYGPGSEVSLSYAFLRRDYDTRTDVVLPGTSIRFLRHEWQLALQHAWDRKQRWRTTTKLSFAKNNDNGSDYFEYARYRASAEMRYLADPWEFIFQARYDHYFFPVQTVSDTDLNKRAIGGFAVSLQGERKLTKALKVYTQFEHEQSFSNRPNEDYDVNTLRIGVDWAF
jgi:hypothetical protein